jgi:hypothetical protein
MPPSGSKGGVTRLPGSKVNLNACDPTYILGVLARRDFVPLAIFPVYEDSDLPLFSVAMVV